MAESFLKRVFGKVFAGRAGAPGVIVGAFGKHPGYPEHFEDLDGQAILTRLREQLYTHGVQAAVDAGVWKELHDQGEALPFRHTLVWRTGGSGGGSLVVGRMLASRDKLGRDKYPIMVVSVCPDPNALEFALLQVLPWVETVMQDCVAAATLPDVKAVIARARESSPVSPEQNAAADSDPETQSDRAAAFLSRCPELGAGAKGLVSILYQVDREMGAFVPASTSTSGSWNKTANRRSAHIRVPRCAKSTAESVAVWFRLLNGILAESAPILLMIPDEEPDAPAWVDIIVGVPTEAEFFYLRSSTQTTPCTSDIPYTIPPEFAAKTLERFKAAAKQFPAPVEILSATNAPIPTGSKQPTASAGKSPLSRGRMVALLLVSLSLVVALIAWQAVSHFRHGTERAAVVDDGLPPPNKSADVVPSTARPVAVTPIAVTPATLPVAVGRPVTDVHPIAPPVAAIDPPKPAVAATEPSQADIAQRQAYLDSIRKDKGPLASAPLNQLWCDRRDGFLAANPLASYADLKAGMDALSAPLLAVDSNEALHRDPELNWSGNQSWIPDLRAAVGPLVASHRDAAIKAAANALSDSPRAIVASSMQSTTEPLLPPQASRAIDNFAAWEKEVDRLGREWIQADQLLDCGAAVDQAVDGTPAGHLSAADIAANWKSNPLMREASVSNALAPVIARVDTLLKLNSATRDDLSKAASSPDSFYGIRLAAWRNLGKLKQHWPATDTEWAAECGARDAIAAELATRKASVSQAPADAWQSGQLDSVAKELASSGLDRWMRYATELPANPADIEKHLSTASTYADRSGVDRSQLPAALRYDFSVLALHNQIADAKPDDQKLRDAMNTFCAATEPLKLDADHVAKVRAELSARPQLTTGAKADGPTQANFQPQQTGPDEMVFTAPWAKPVALHFIRLNLNDGTSHYLCSSEMSVGLFISTVEERGSWDELKTILPTKNMTANRLSPRTWTWTDDRMQSAPTWMPGHATSFADYPPALVGTSGQLLNSSNGNDPKPTADQPIQFVSTKSAVYVAALLGCRIPTALEWSTAVKMDSALSAGAAVPRGTAVQDNLRDHTWALERDYFANLKVDDQQQLPDFNACIFTPPGKAPGLVVNAKPTDTDDGTLWFRKVGLQNPASSNHRFSDLVGNVAEYVTDQPIAAGQWPAVGKSVAGVANFIRDHGNSMRVIGGSALSAPDLPVDQPQLVDSKYADRGFSDTGFRLAFSAAEIPFRDRALAAVALIQYQQVKPAASQ